MIEQFKSIGIDIALTFARQFLAGLLKLGIIFLIARLLGANGAGIYSISLLLPTVLSQMLNLGLVSANVYFIASRRFELQQVWSSSRDLVLFMALIGTLLGGGAVLLAGETLFPGADTALLLFALGIYPTALLNGLVTGIYQAQQDFRLYNILVLIEPIVTMVLLFLLWIADSFTLVWVLAATLAGYACTSLVGLFCLSRSTRLWAVSHDRWAYLQPALQYGVMAHLSNLVTFLNYRLDIYLVNLFLGPAATGIYTIAVRLAEQVWIISQAVSTVIFPRLSALHDQVSDRDLLTVTIARMTFWISFAASLLLLLLARPFTELFFGAEFDPTSSVLVFLLPGIAILACSRVLANDLAARGKIVLNFIFALVVLIVNIIATLAFIPLWGLVGAALATSLTYGMDFLVRLILHRRISTVPWWRILAPQPDDVRWLRRLGK